LALNPEGKMPLLASEATGLAVPESDTICRLLMHEYKDKGPSFLPNEVKSNLIARIHDTYISPIQGCIYKAAPPFGVFSTREKAIAELRRQLNNLENLLDEQSTPYLLGQEVSYGDAALFPTLIFITHCLPKFGVPDAEVLPPKLGQWFKTIIKNDVDFARVHEEVR
jgi:glutathione S-transferase